MFIFWLHNNIYDQCLLLKCHYYMRQLRPVYKTEKERESIHHHYVLQALRHAR